MRSPLVLALMISTLAAAPTFAATPPHSTLEDWKAYRATDHADTLVVEAPYDTVWAATVRAMVRMQYKFARVKRDSGEITTPWEEHSEFPPDFGAEWFLTKAMINAGAEPAFTVPECPDCWFTVINDRRVVELGRVSNLRTRVIVRAQYVGVPRGQTDPIALRSTGGMERALLKRLRELLGK